MRPGSDAGAAGGALADTAQDAETPIVGIGASAGGLDALKRLVSAIPERTGACYVIIQHLAPDQASIMDRLLRPDSAIPISQIEDGEAARPDHVYIVPPGVTLRLHVDRFDLTERGPDRAVFRPIDMFLSSLAEEKGRDAYCVILSGTGTDGTERLKAVKAAGGFALVQNSSGARFPGMPDSAVATGLVDAVLPAEAIADRLADIVAHRQSLRDDDAGSAMQAEIAERLDTIAEILATASGNDFSGYKPGTLVRRIERRMALMRLRSVEQFIETLRGDTAQADLLAQEFLIGVTRFFRDPEAFEALRRRVVRPVLEHDAAHVRVWVPGCSTGEEAYSIAMLFLEEMEAQGRETGLQVFGTDIDKAALVHARQGLYQAAAIEPLSAEQRARFFSIEKGQYRVAPELREACVFAPHNLTQDPPFSRLDLIACRNLLIYLSHDLQKRVIPRLHFALRAGGHLFLGPSEGISGEDTLFVRADDTHRIFRKISDSQTKYSALKDPLPKPRAPDRPAAARAVDMPAGGPDTTPETLAEREFLARFAAPFALVSEAGEIAYLSRRMTEFVAPVHGVPSSNIDAYLAPELRLPVRNALSEARESGQIVTVRDVTIQSEGAASFVDLQLGPAEADPTLFLLTLTRVRGIEDGSVSAALERREASDQDMLETENFNLRRQLSAALSEYETSSQALRSSNEELLSMNEELQSSNQELETSREELQSINEELETVNAELQENNRLLTRANSDLKNLFESTDVAVLFLDRQFCVRNFTPATTALFGIRERDVGRPISDLASRMDYPGLAEDAAAVDESLSTLEREVRIAATGETFLLRIKPYRTVANVIDGYVLAFLDISTRKTYEDTLERNREDLARQYAELENLYDTTPVGLALVGPDMRYIRINETLAAMNGAKAEAHIGETVRALLPDVAGQTEAALRRVFDTGAPLRDVEITGETPADPGATRHFIGDYYPVMSDGTVFAVGICVRDVTEQKRLYAALEESQAQMRRLFDAAPVFIAVTEGPDHVYTYSNPAHDAIVGHRPLIGKPIREALPELAGQSIIERFDTVYREGETVAVPEFFARFDRDGDGTLQEGWFMQTLEPVRDGAGRTIGVASFAYEISDIVAARNAAKRSDAQKTVLLGELQHRVKNTLATISAISKLIMRPEETAEAYQRRLTDRLQAISRTHDLLTEADWTDIRFDALVQAEFAPYSTAERTRHKREGPDFALDSGAAVTLGMALHELVTNAAKYGALSNTDGWVSITTALTPQEDGPTAVHLTWKECGGPAITEAPARRGFGSLVFDRILARDLNARVRNEYAADGLVFGMDFEIEAPT